MNFLRWILSIHNQTQPYKTCSPILNLPKIYVKRETESKAQNSPRKCTQDKHFSQEIELLRTLGKKKRKEKNMNSRCWVHSLYQTNPPNPLERERERERETEPKVQNFPRKHTHDQNFFP
jgi:hypothetical protein